MSQQIWPKLLVAQGWQRVTLTPGLLPYRRVQYKNYARRKLFIWYSNLDSDTQISFQCCVFQLVKPAPLCTVHHPKKKINDDRCWVVSRQFTLPSSFCLLRWSGLMPLWGNGWSALHKAWVRESILRNINSNKENCQQTSGSSGANEDLPGRLGIWLACRLTHDRVLI